MGFSENIKVRAAVASGRCCCICHKFCGTKMQFHHIKQKAYDGRDTFDNCIPLCLDCHADMGKADPNHAVGRSYTEKELLLHRDNWYRKVSIDKDQIEAMPLDTVVKIFNKVHNNDTVILEEKYSEPNRLNVKRRKSKVMRNKNLSSNIEEW